MLLFLLPYVFGLLALGLIGFPFIRYLWDSKDLRRFPSPAIAGLSSIWRIWHNLNFNHYAAVDEAHRRLGSHVRIAPNHISILDPQAPNDVYGHGASMLKDAMYDAAAGDFRNLVDARVKEEHQTKRKMFAHVFSAKVVVGFEPILVENLKALMKQIDSHADAGSKIDMRLMLNYFTIDFLGKILYSRTLGCLDRGSDMLDAQSKDGTVYKVPFIQSLLDATVVNTVLGFIPSLLPITRPVFSHHPYKKKGANWDNIIYHNTVERLKNGGNEGDLFAKLLKDNKGKDLNLHIGEIIAEASVMSNAGTETTTAALTATVYLLYTHPKVLSKLREEIEVAVPENDLPSYEVASKLPYLRACIEESLRVRPASSMGLPRVVPKGGRVVAGKFIPEGVTVSVPTYSLLRDEAAFENASEFNPDRWLTDDPEKKRRMTNNHLPFSTGPRACIGRNIAYFEQIMLIATLIKFYNFTIPEGFQLETQERFNSNPGNLIVKVSRR